MRTTERLPRMMVYYVATHLENDRAAKASYAGPIVATWLIATTLLAAALAALVHFLA